MSYQVLARKWRPRNFTEMVGQTHVLRVLINALDTQRLHHAYLFTGTRGVGKTTVARIFAKSLNCEKGVSAKPCGACSSCREIDAGRFIDLIEVDAASRTGVDDTRNLLENVQYAPGRGRYKVYLIDEVHMLTVNSFNALLKTLEEPPAHVKFLLATTDPQKLPATVLSRCLQFNLKRIPVDQIIAHLTHVITSEGVTFDRESPRLLALAADGSMRDALSLLDQAIAFGGGALSREDVGNMLGTLEQGAVPDLLTALAANDGAALLERIAAMAEHNPDFSAVLAGMLSFLQKLALAQAVPATLNAEDGEYEVLQDLSKRLAPEDVQLFYQIALIGRRDLPLAPEPRGGFEMVLLRMLAFRPYEQAREPHIPRVSAGTTPKQSPPAPPTATSGTGDEWSNLVRSLALAGMVKQLADNCVLKLRDGNRMELALPPVHASLHRADWESRLQQALEKHLGAPVHLRIKIEEPEKATPAALQEHAQMLRQQEAEAKIADDPAVIAMQELLDARIDKVTPKI
ncbi:MAG: DNA polymerase III subunit gamma/tau [Gammaproteobacteria bacterium]|nr:DNA polymerase III subunit gamma/tau [Gammaproteobacteria bacterium]